MDEALAQTQDLQSDLRALGWVDGPGRYVVNINPLTELAVRQLVGPEIFISAGAQSLRWRSELVEGEVAQHMSPVRRHARPRAQAQ